MSYEYCLAILRKNFREELVEFYASFELSLEVCEVHSAKISRKKLAELNVSSKLCPVNIAQAYLQKNFGKS